MSRTGITYQDVFDAATSIEQNGAQATIEKIRIFLGETGSNTTISKYLQLWRNKVNPSTVINLSKISSTPDIVKQAVERVWQDMREETDKEILSIKTEAQKLVDEAERKAHLADVSFNEIKNKHDHIFDSYQAERAEKELLLLDIKKLREEHTLLQERSKALETRYTEMQSLTSQHLMDLSNAHKNEVSRLEEAVKLQLESHIKLVNTIKDHSAQEKHQHIVVIDSLNIENIKLSDNIKNLQAQLQDKFSHIKKLESNLNVLTMERDTALNRLNEQDEQWSFFKNKKFVSDDIISKIYDAPKLDNLISSINIIFEKSVDKKFIEFEKVINCFKASSSLNEKDKDELSE